MRHSNEDPSSDDVNSQSGVLSVVGPSGPDVIVVCGGAVSTVKVWLDAEGSVLPAASVARTSTVGCPSLSTPVVYGDVHAAKAALTTRHSNVESDSDEMK
jgi:hypothetical protein